MAAANAMLRLKAREKSLSVSMNCTFKYFFMLLKGLTVQTILLYLPTQIRFPIGGERVMCHGSKLTNSLGRTKLTNSPGKQ